MSGSKMTHFFVPLKGTLQSDVQVPFCLSMAFL